jgi:hypothetical protein
MSAKWSTQVLGNRPNFGELLKDEFTVVLLRGKNTFGDLIYCYLKITFPDLEKLEAALKGDVNFNASDFGTVVAAGKGEPSDEVKAEIATIYPMLQAHVTTKPVPQEIPTEKKNWDEY